MSPKSERPPSSGKLPARRARNAALAALVVIAVAFIVLSTWQLAAQVFGYAPSAFPVSAGCAGPLRSLEEAVDRGRARAALERDPDQAAKAFLDAVDAPLGDVERHCTTDKDYEGYVAARRLRDGALAQIGDDHTNLARFRRAVDMRLSL